MFLYVLITMLISFFSMIDTMDLDKLKELSNVEWLKLIGKSFLPAFISLKAFFDDSVINKTEQSTEENNNV